MPFRDRRLIPAAIVLFALAACGAEEPERADRGGGGPGAAPAAAVSTVELVVPGMTCPLCSRAIEARLQEAGLREIAIDLETKVVSARFDPRRVTPEEVKALVEEQGFDVLELRVEDWSREGGGD